MACRHVLRTVDYYLPYAPPTQLSSDRERSVVLGKVKYSINIALPWRLIDSECSVYLAYVGRNGKRAFGDIRRSHNRVLNPVYSDSPLNFKIAISTS